MFKRQAEIKAKRIKLNLDSDLSVNLIDTLLVDLHPSFIRPAGPFFIQAIGEITGTGGLKNCFTVYAENNGNHYLIEIEAVEDNIESVAIYQNVLTLAPEEGEWEQVLKDMSSRDLEMDGIHYLRSLGGDADHADLCELHEHIKTNEDAYDCLNRMMLFERTISPGDFKEKLKTVVEVIDSRQQAGVSFYLGFSLHPSTLTLLGN